MSRAVSPSFIVVLHPDLLRPKFKIQRTAQKKASADRARLPGGSILLHESAMNSRMCGTELRMEIEFLELRVSGIFEIGREAWRKAQRYFTSETKFKLRRT